MEYELKEAVVSFDGFKSFLTASIDNNMDLKALEDGLKYFEGISNTTKVLNYLKNDYYPNKIGNEKIGDDTIVLNVNNPFRCVSSQKNHCKCDGFCYAKRICNQYKNSGLYTLCQEIQFEKLNIDQIKASIELNLTKEVKSRLKLYNFSNFEVKLYDYLDIYLSGIVALIVAIPVACQQTISINTLIRDKYFTNGYSLSSFANKYSEISLVMFKEINVLTVLNIILVLIALIAFIIIILNILRCIYARTKGNK